MHGVFVTSGMGERGDWASWWTRGLPNSEDGTDDRSGCIVSSRPTVQERGSRVENGRLPGPGVSVKNVNGSFVTPSPGLPRVSPFAPRYLGDDGRRRRRSLWRWLGKKGDYLTVM